MKRKRIIRTGGQNLFEFALITLTMITVIVAIIDFGRWAFSYSTLTNASREGARYGVIFPPCDVNEKIDFRNVIKERAIGLNLTDSDIPDPIFDNFNCSTKTRIDTNIPATIDVIVIFKFVYIIPFIPDSVLNSTTRMYLEL